MSLTESNMLKLGIQAPDFNLLNVVNGNLVSLSAMNNYQAYVIFLSAIIAHM